MKNIKWNEYTWYSRLAAFMFFLAILPAWTFYLGVQYQETKNILSQKFIDIPLKNIPPVQSATTTSNTNSAEGAPEGSIHNLPVPAGVAAARKQLSQNFKIAENKIIIMSAYEKEWSDSCLGLGGPAESCAAVITPGFEVILEVQGKTYVYRTNVNGTSVRSEK